MFIKLKDFIRLIIFTFLLLSFKNLHAQKRVREYNLVIKKQIVRKAGKPVEAITVNDSIPGPVLHFTEGDSAVIRVKNEMHVATSTHWHGLLLPNVMDGVPYLSTPPIEPGKTFTYRFPLRQNGTYWYHSHTMFQEQEGLYGGIVIQPKAKQAHDYDKEIVLVLSDWTNEKPHHVLKNLKRGLEWYSIEKGTAQSLNRVISHHGLKDRINMAFHRMPPMDISDVYYNKFLVNGHNQLSFPELKAGERVRVRVIDGSSSTFFNLQYAGGKMTMIAADGQDVQPLKVDRVLQGIAETYDFIITVPDNGAYEFRATAQDGSGHSSVFFGDGKKVYAHDLAKPDLFHMSTFMGGMTNMKGMKGMKMQGMGGMKMDAGDMKGVHNKDTTDYMNMTAAGPQNKSRDSSAIKKEMMQQKNGMAAMNHQSHEHMNMTAMQRKGDTIIFNYGMLKSVKPTDYDTADHPVRKITLNLTGSMWRYNWNINGRALSSSDKIMVNPGEVLRIKMVNKTMMHHPMHLHGHLFRVLNGQGDYDPLKHTVDVPPMSAVTIEFKADENGAWFFHCHVLYHMMSGMARVFEYKGFKKDSIMDSIPEGKFLKEDRKMMFWGEAEAASNMGHLGLTLSNAKNVLQLDADDGWKYNHYEATATYARFLSRFFRVYGGVVASNKDEYLDYYKDHQKVVPGQEVRGVVGVRYLLPLFINADLRIDNRAHARLELDGETWLFPRIWLNYGWNTDNEYHVKLEGLINGTFSVNAGYDSDYKWGGGIMARF